ncbi:hypothetical protein [Streptomyces sp. NBC_00191]|uniref:hypothetical protein n=1 Tax=Streptomyces sp. NBC_00191 TaxID=2975674 RepID=UPI00386AEDDC
MRSGRGSGSTFAREVRNWATGYAESAGAAGHPASTARRTKQRNTVERRINRLKQWRGMATRYEKTAAIYLAGLHIAGIFLWSVR